MKKQILTLLFISLTAAASFLSFTGNSSTESLQMVSQRFQRNMDHLDEIVVRYDELASNLKDDSLAIVELQVIHTQTRLQYKSAEFLLEYFDRYSIKKYINGAPLPTVEPKVPELIPVEPVGLQVLDELVFSDDPFAEKAAIAKLTKKLKASFGQVKNYQSNNSITHRHIFEATRQELVRIFTLGLTGFDTPGSGNAIPEATEAMKSLANTMNSYYPVIANKDQVLADEIRSTFESAFIELAMSYDFDGFDRLEYLVKYINPLYALVLEAHEVLGIETIEETTGQVQAVNYKVDNIFDPNFLNADYYANIKLSDPITQKRIALGRTLFYDPILSSNNERSCNSCHRPELAFTDGQVKSKAMDGKGHIQRNSPSLVNSVYSERYFYDLREPKLERQIKHVVHDTMEFATSFKEIIGKLKQSKEYQDLFAAAYADQPQYVLTNWSVSDALASYVASLQSFNSPFDQYVRGEKKEISPAEHRGFNLFMGKAACGTCHFAPTFSGIVPPIYDESESEILGVPTTNDTINTTLDPDLGRYASHRTIDQAPFYRHSFKTVTVRNVELTAPYMHNGVYETLEEVVDFYNRGGGAGMGMEVPYQTLPDAPLNLSEQEQSDLVAFMKSLTDQSIPDTRPERLPTFEGQPEWNKRKIGGTY